MMRISIIFLAAFMVACSPVSKVALNKKFKLLEKKLQNHTGFMLYDIEKKRELYAFQSDQYFTPASNTKIFTFYAALTLLDDSIPSIHYIEKGDSLIFRGAGDPSFLYKNSFDSRKAYDFLVSSNKQLFFSNNNFYSTELGPGWAWDDYQFTFSSERSAFPIYGNHMAISHREGLLKVFPQLFSYDITIADSVEASKVVRNLGSNKIIFQPGGKYKKTEEWKIPFKTETHVIADLLSDTLKKKVNIITDTAWTSSRTIFSTPVDSLYKVMMQESDNFIAEQLLLQCADVVSDSLKPEIAIAYMKKNYLSDLPDNPIWVDGSGVSRYNQFTPRSIVRLWEKIYECVPRERLFQLLAIGGKTGTIKNYFKSDPPYIFGKTGTLTNVRCLSGYLVTKKGRTFIFSFMSNNHPVSASTVQKEMEMILKEIYTKN